MAYITNLPVNNTFGVTAYFGQKGKYWKTYHKGIDIVGDHTLYSMCNGVVTYTGYDSGWGNYVSVMPNGFSRIRIILAHMVSGSIKVKKGDKVTRTTALGNMGASGNVSGVHVHCEMRIDNIAVDPTPYMLIANKKASRLNSVDYKTTEIEADKLLQGMLDKFDGKTDCAEIKAENKRLKADNKKLNDEIKKANDEIKALNKRISDIKSYVAKS